MDVKHQSGNIIIALLAALGTVSVGVGVLNNQTSQKQKETQKRIEDYDALLASRNAVEIAAYLVKKQVLLVEKPAQEGGFAHLRKGDSFQLTNLVWELVSNDVNGQNMASFSLKNCNTIGKKLFEGHPGTAQFIDLPRPEEGCSAQQSTTRNEIVNFLKLNADGTVNMAQPIGKRVKGVISASGAPPPPPPSPSPSPSASPTGSPNGSPSGSPSAWLGCKIWASKTSISLGERINFEVTTTPGISWSVTFDTQHYGVINSSSSAAEFNNWEPTSQGEITYMATVYEGMWASGDSATCTIKITVNPPAPLDCTLTADKSSVEVGESFFVEFIAAGPGRSLRIDPIPGAYWNDLYLQQNPVVNFNYILNTPGVTRLTATIFDATYQSGSSETCFVDITVLPPDPLKCSIIADPNPIVRGSSTTLTVTVEGSDAASIFVDQGAGSVNGSYPVGSSADFVVSPQSSTWYTATVYKGSGQTGLSRNCAVRVAVTPPEFLECSLTPAPPVIYPGSTYVNVTMTVTKGYAHSLTWGSPINYSKPLWGTSLETDTQGTWISKTTTFTATITEQGKTANCSVTVPLEPPDLSCSVFINGYSNYSDSIGKEYTVNLTVNNVQSQDILYMSINGVPFLNSYGENATEDKTFSGYASTIYGEVTCTGTFTLINTPPESGIKCSLTTSPSNPITPGANVTTTMTATGPVTQAILGTDAYNPPSFPIVSNQTFQTDGYVTGVVFDSSGKSYTCKAKVTTTDNVMCTLTATPDSINSDGGGVSVTLKLTVLGNAASVNLNGTDMPVSGTNYSVVVPNVVGTRNFLATVTGGDKNKKSIQCGITVLDSGNTGPKSCTVKSGQNPAPRNESITVSISTNNSSNIVGSTIDGQDSGTGLSYYFGSGFMNTKFVHATVTWGNGQTANCNYRQDITYDPCEDPIGSGGLCIFDPFGYTCDNFISAIPPPVECRGASNNGCKSCQDYPPGVECKPPWVTINCPLASIGIKLCTWQACATDQGTGSDPDDCMRKAQAEHYNSFLFINCPPIGNPSGSPSTTP